MIFWYTVLSRNITLLEPKFELFWSYKVWFAGDWNVGIQILGNIVLFLPFGFLMSELCIKRRVLLFAVLFSCTIEIIQLISYRGLFEFDDILNNTIGAALGIIVFSLLKGKKIKTIIGGLSVIGVGISCFLTIKSEDSLSRYYCFQLDKDLSGFFFRYDRDASADYKLLLQSTETGKKYKLKALYGLNRTDVNKYFSSNHNYSMAGFQIESIPYIGEYEVIVELNPFAYIHTGVFISENGIHYYPEKKLFVPEISEDFIKYGTLRVYRPDFHIWVYQWNEELYWIVDSDFYFKDNEFTYVEYQLWTTQINKLPQHRLQNKWFWDNLGANFEDYEVDGDFGSYRVMKRELPTDYSITAIMTGYYMNGEWIWQNYFRPIYKFY